MENLIIDQTFVGYLGKSGTPNFHQLHAEFRDKLIKN